MAITHKPLRHYDFGTAARLSLLQFCRIVDNVTRCIPQIEHLQPSDEVIAMDNMTMSDEDKMKFFQTNAQKVFKIKAA